MKWVLWVYITGMYNGTQHSVPDFATEHDCRRAEMQVQTQMAKINRGRSYREFVSDCVVQGTDVPLGPACSLRSETCRERILRR